MKKETYAEARLRLMREAGQHGLETQVTSRGGKPLKKPRIFRKGMVSTEGVEFGAQSVLDLRTGYSTFVDPRGMSWEDFAKKTGLLPC